MERKITVREMDEAASQVLDEMITGSAPLLACCIWSEDGFDSHAYSTGCGEYFFLDDSTLAKNKMVFCCFCGKRIEEHLSDIDE